MAEKVTLVHPTTGVEVTTDNAVEINDLRFGSGYRIKEDPEPVKRADEAPPPGRRPVPRLGGVPASEGDEKPEASTSNKGPTR